MDPSDSDAQALEDTSSSGLDAFDALEWAVPSWKDSRIHFVEFGLTRCKQMSLENPDRGTGLFAALSKPNQFCDGCINRINKERGDVLLSDLIKSNA